MAGHQLIDDHLTDLARHLPPDVVDELADGLTETWQRHLAAGLPPAQAARDAIAEFGTTGQIIDAFVAHSAGRRTARLLLATGPLVGACWGAALVVAHVWAWPVPTPVAVVFAGALLAVVAALVLSATSRHDYRRARLGAAGGCGLVALDLTMVIAVLSIAPALVWPVAIAVPLSLVRIGLTLRSLPASGG
jgi:hypothetical protein